MRTYQVTEPALRDFLQRARNGEDPDELLIELYANCTRQDDGGEVDGFIV